MPEEKLDDLTMALFESADSDNSGSITFEELREELQHFPEIMENLTIRYFDHQTTSIISDDRHFTLCAILVLLNYQEQENDWQTSAGSSVPFCF